MSAREDTLHLTNRTEYDSFLRNALALTGSITPKIILRVAIVVAYAALITFLDATYELYQMDLAPFEFTGIVLGIILVFRLNAGYDRWWEARKWWGSIVNQSRNLAICSRFYTGGNTVWFEEFLGRVACLPYVFKDSLRSVESLKDYESFLGKEKGKAISLADHMPTYAASEITSMIHKANRAGELDGFAMLKAQNELGKLIDAVGACERILKTPIPLVIAINTRRFIFAFLALLPFALAKDLGWSAPAAIGLIGYALLSLDQIGIELQHPFDPQRRSHLPLDDICKAIATNVLSLLESKSEE